MLGLLTKYIQDASVLRRLLFAVTFLNSDLPMYWDTVMHFATAGKVSSVTPEQIKVLVENLQSLDEAAFGTDTALRKELICLLSRAKNL